MKRTLALLAVVATPALAHADRRSFTQTYEYMTAPAGQTEVELHTRQARSTWADGAPESFTFALEVEHGITERWDIALYHVFEQASDATAPVPLHLSEIKLESRYRFAERGELPVDLAAYGELVRAFGASAYEAEAKAIVARDFGKVTAAVNLIGAVEFGADVAETEVEAGWAAGVTYEVSPTWKVGAESWGGFEVEYPDEVTGWAGPAASWAPSAQLWVAATAGFGLTSTSDKFSIGGIVGLNL
ncbi:MAG: hypothetical protein R3B06_24870 [Kofleriaceae bacterium]